MKYHVVTLFPEMIARAAEVSILGRAIKNGFIQLDITYIRDFSTNTRLRVDDYPYGGGAGMVMEAEPVFRAVQKAKEAAGKAARVIYLTPQAKVLDQTMVEELAREEDLILLCGHYEGIDERVLEEVVTDYISIGDYVLTGGELGALVLMDAVSRFVPGVLHNEESSQFESLQDNLLEYPHYTRPEVWHGKKVPEVLLSGDHKKVEEWRHAESLKRTAERRPDLLDAVYRVTVVSFGSETCLEKAGRLCAAVSRYGTVLDYNRAKLKKQHRKFTGKEFLLFVSDLPGTAEITEALREVTRHMKAKSTPAVFARFRPTFGEGESAAELGTAGREALAEVLSESGFRPAGITFPDSEDGKNSLTDAALFIKKRIRSETAPGKTDGPDVNVKAAETVEAQTGDWREEHERLGPEI